MDLRFTFCSISNLWLLALLGLSAVSVCQGQYYGTKGILSNVLSSNMVLQRAPQRSNLWGWVAPHSTVTVIMKDPSGAIVEQGTTESDVNGTWLYTLQPYPADFVAYSFWISGGGRSGNMTNVLFGDLYIISGQSNCQLGVGAMYNSTYELSLAPLYPYIRFWKATRSPRFMDYPNPELDSVNYNPPWQPNSASVLNGVSAVGWFMVRTMFDMLPEGQKTPFGLLTDCFATQLECYMSLDSLAECDYVNPFPCFGNVPNTTFGSKSLVFNSNVYPLLNLRNRGFILYKGEGEVGREDVWQCAVNSMVKDYRAKWGYTNPQDWGYYWIMTQPWIMTDDLPRMRLAQGASSLVSNPNAYFASAIDQGDPTGDIHPNKKVELGRRMAMLMMGLNMGIPGVQWKGPNVTGWQQLSPLFDPQVVLQLEIEPSSIGAGLAILPGTSVCPAAYRPASVQCAGWEVADSYGRWYAGNISFSDETNTTLLLRANLPAGEKVTGVQFGFAPWPLVDLYNKDGLPVTPFRIQGPYNATSPTPALPTTAAPLFQPDCQLIEGWFQDYDLNLINNFRVNSVQECCTSCFHSTKGCQSWTQLENLCFLLKTPFTYDGARARPNTTSGWCIQPTTGVQTTSIPGPPMIYGSSTGTPAQAWQQSLVNGWTENANFTFAGTGNVSAVPAPCPNLTATDGVFVRSRLLTMGTSPILYVQKFDLNVPPGATVTGLQVQMFRRASNTGWRDSVVALAPGGVAAPDTDACAFGWCPVRWTTGAGALDVLGGQGLMWGLSSSSLTPSVLNSDTFGLALQCVNNATFSASGFVDSVTVTVYWSLPATSGAVMPTTARGSTGTTSTGTTSTGTTSTGTTSTGTTGPVTTSTGSTQAAAPATTGTTAIAVPQTTAAAPATTAVAAPPPPPPQCDTFVDFTGSTGQLIATIRLAQQRVRPGTISFWVRSNGLRGKDQTLVSYGAYNSLGVSLQLRPGNYLGVWHGSVYANSTYAVPTMQWVFVSAVASAGNAWSFYENGVFKASVVVPPPAPGPLAGDKFAIAGHGGRANELSNGNLDGAMDGIQIWTTQRTPEQMVSVDSLPSYDPNGLTGTETGLVFYLPLNEGGGLYSVPRGSGVMSDTTFNNSGTFSWGSRVCQESTTSTGTTSTGTTSTGLAAPATTSSGTTGVAGPVSTTTGIASPGATSTGTTGTTSTGTTSTGTSSTGTTSTGTTSTGTTATSTTAPAVVYSKTRFCNSLSQSSTTNGWDTAWYNASAPGTPLPLTPTADRSARGKDNVFVHKTLAPGVTSSVLLVTQFSNALPADAVVVGIQAILVRRASGPGIRDVMLALVIDGVVQTGTNICASGCGTDWSSAAFPPNVYLGGNGQLWGSAPGSITTAVGNNARFGLALQISNVGSATVEALLDEVDLVLWYTIGSATTSTGTTSTGTTSTGTTSTGALPPPDLPPASTTSPQLVMTPPTPSGTAASSTCSNPDFASDFSGRTGSWVFTHGTATSSTRVTLAAWVYLNDVPTGPAYQVVMHNGIVASNGFGIAVAPDTADVGVIIGGTGPTWSSYELPTRLWVWLAVTSDGVTNSWTVIADGVKQAEYLVQGTLLTPTETFLVGGDGLTTAHNFDGKIDDVVVYRKNLTEAQIGAVSGPGVLTGNEANSAFYLPFREGAGAVTSPAGFAADRGQLTLVGSMAWSVRQCLPTPPPSPPAALLADDAPAAPALAAKEVSSSSGNAGATFIAGLAAALQTSGAVAAVLALVAVVVAVRLYRSRAHPQSLAAGRLLGREASGETANGSHRATSAPVSPGSPVISAARLSVSS